MRPAYCFNCNPYIDKTSLYWDGPKIPLNISNEKEEALHKHIYIFQFTARGLKKTISILSAMKDNLVANLMSYAR